ncbi:SDR family oxidoreductase [Prescottella agglutinans]|uniref:SDR family oxidoreductase n=1 Tax=Prescottella agglutinans TaxID=1644129 RepID=A0A438BFE7_9NOCA|nr:SDR family NAD(P)-dependent oxidoreductase [Prescottella agglutinans]RVW09714.1 SDR family oxidoreductase [Prescottella agglutinans]
MLNNIAERTWSPLPRPGTRVLLTGAAGGLGQALSAALLEVGAHVVGIDRVSETTAEGQVIIEADLTKGDEVGKAVADAAERLGGIDSFVGAAGVVDTIHRAAAFPGEAFQADVDVNLTGQFRVAQAAYPYLREAENAAITFVTSQAGLDGLPGQASYAAAKAGLVGLTATLATEWVSDGIRVNAVAPGLFDTPKVLAMPATARERMLAGVPMHRTGTLDEVVGPILFLLSPAAGYITGRTLRLDGGAGLALTGLFR